MNLNGGNFHPGNFPDPKPPKRRKGKRCILKKKTLNHSLNRLLPLESPDSPYITEFLMHNFSIASMFQLASSNEYLLNFYQTTPILNPYVQTLKDSIQRKADWSFRNQVLRTAFKRLAQLWLYKKYKSRLLNTVDVATLEVPKKPIYVFDSKAKGSYVFEATTLKRSIDSDLSFTDWLFPDPQMPRNAWTNCSFTLAQLVAIQRGLYKYEFTSPFLELLKKARWKLLPYIETYRVPIKLEGLKNMIRNKTSDEFITLMTEFIEDEYEYHDIEFQTHLVILKWAVIHCIQDAYIIQWISLFEQYNKLCILNSSRVLDRGDILFDAVHNSTYCLLTKHKEIARLGRQRLYRAIK